MSELLIALGVIAVGVAGGVLLYGLLRGLAWLLSPDESWDEYELDSYTLGARLVEAGYVAGRDHDHLPFTEDADGLICDVCGHEIPPSSTMWAAADEHHEIHGDRP